MEDLKDQGECIKDVEGGSLRHRDSNQNRQFKLVFLTEPESYHHERRAAMSYRPSPLRTQQGQANAGIWSLESGKPGTGEPAGASNLVPVNLRLAGE
jgi:hypothetical protein